MSIFDNYNISGKNNIKATSTDFTDMVGKEGLKDIVKKVFSGGNVRDITEFITQKRLLNSYFAILDLYMKDISTHTDFIETYSKYIAGDLIRSKGDAKLLDLWLLGLTKKGLDNIVRTERNIIDYQYSFTNSMNAAVNELKNTYGELSGTIEINNRKLGLNWNVLSLIFMTIGAQTLSIRGSAKSMNGKMFEKLVLGTLLTTLGFTFLTAPPKQLDKDRKFFWLSNMDENEREIDATVIYNGNAVSIDIGFIGKGNPEITLDKVTRFNAYKQIGGLKHNMTTIIIVDTVGENSDLFRKAERVNGHVFQMKNPDWTIEFTKTLCSIMELKHELAEKEVCELEKYFDAALDKIDMQKFVR